MVSLLTGEPEYLDPLKAETPVGWIVTGYPWYDIKTPEHAAFLKAYQDKYTTIRASARWSATRDEGAWRRSSPRPARPIPRR